MATINPTPHSPAKPNASRTSHVSIPIAEYDAFVANAAAAGPSRDAIERAAAMFADPATKWYDAESILKNIVADGLSHVRQESGLTQAQLGELANMPQSQVSRLEKTIDAATIRVLRRIATALTRNPPLSLTPAIASASAKSKVSPARTPRTSQRRAV